MRWFPFRCFRCSSSPTLPPEPPTPPKHHVKHHVKIPPPPPLKNNILPEYEFTKSYIPPITQGKVIKVYDGDTITLSCSLNLDKSTLYRFQVRLRGIDCAEMNSNDPNEVQVAILAQQFVIDHTLGHIVYLKNVALDKYGRILAHVYLTSDCTSPSLSDLLLLENLAVPYAGKTKHSPSNWLHYYQGLDQDQKKNS